MVLIPRIASILYALFLMVFALEEWGDPLGMFMQALPGLILLAVTALAWKREIIGVIGYLILSIISLSFFKGNYFIILYTFLPLFIIFLLYFWSWKKSK